MPGCFLVEQRDGPAYDPARARREQDGWSEHAAFMDALAERRCAPPELAGLA